MKKIAAGKFKANCLAIMDEVQKKRISVVITKRGKPVAKLVPMNGKKDEIFGFLVGKGKIVGDVVKPALTLEEWGESGVILLDTHVVVWLAFDPQKISVTAQRTIDEARKNAETLAISAITLVELGNMIVKGKITILSTVQAFLQEIENTFAVLPITVQACARISALPASFPRDPADRLITATALVEGLQLMTVDGEIRKSKVVPTIW